MNTKTTSLLLAGLLATAGAWAQVGPGTGNAPSSMDATAQGTLGNGSTMGTNMGTSDAAPVTSSTGTMGASPSVAEPSVVVVPVAPVAVVTTTTEMGAPAGREVPRWTASGTSNVPTKAGEASTMTNGVPNAQTYNPNADDGRMVYPHATVSSRVPTDAGEASTMVNGRPNWNPDDPVIQRRSAMGNRGAIN